MKDGQRPYNLRSGAESQASLSMAESENKDVKKQDESDEHKLADVMALLQLVLVKQDLLLEENKQLKHDMATQQAITSNQSEAIGKLQKVETTYQESLSKELRTTTINAHAALTNIDAEPNLKEKAARQLQSKRINQLLDSTPFSGSVTQDVSDWMVKKS